MIRYIFDPDVVDECALKCIGHPKPQMFDIFAKAMEERYPGHIDNSQPWIYSIAGGAMIQMKLYFASLYEYIMVWGTPIGSEGHSGRHHVAFWDTVIDGETWYYAEGQFEKRIYRPGDRIFVGKRQAVGMNFTNGVWAVEYERGYLPRSIPFGLADELLSARDFVAAKQTLAIYAALIGRHWASPQNRDYPLLLPFKRLAGPIMRAVGNRTAKRLTPPPPKELPRTKPARRSALSRGGDGRVPAGRRPGGRGSVASRTTGVSPAQRIDSKAPAGAAKRASAQSTPAKQGSARAGSSNRAAARPAAAKKAPSRSTPAKQGPAKGSTARQNGKKPRAAGQGAASSTGTTRGPAKRSKS